MEKPGRAALLACLAALALAHTVAAQSVDPKLFSDMRWREIGPMRAGRTRALTGVPSQPATFYLGAVNGGVWKTTDAGKTWTHLGLQDGQQISALAVDPHTANRLFVAVTGHPFGPNHREHTAGRVAVWPAHQHWSLYASSYPV